VLILISCKNNSEIEKLSDLDIVQLVNLKLEKEGDRFIFNDLDSGYYYFVSNLCFACLDEELTKVEKFNSLNEKKISLVVFEDELVVRLSYFVKVTSVYKSNKKLTELNFVLDKKGLDEISLIQLGSLID
jgi:flagellin-specific chaperone FliS